MPGSYRGQCCYPLRIAQHSSLQHHLQDQARQPYQTLVLAGCTLGIGNDGNQTLQEGWGLDRLQYWETITKFTTILEQEGMAKKHVSSTTSAIGID